jgi:hypothetical protein
VDIALAGGLSGILRKEALTAISTMTAATTPETVDVPKMMSFFFSYRIAFRSF